MGSYDHRQISGTRLASASLGAVAVSVTIVVTASHGGSRLGASPFWPWALTGFQVFALWAAGRGRGWGWLVGGSVQVPWIAYALVTTQIGFIPGCLISAAVQIHSFLKKSTTRRPMEVPT